MIAKSGKVALFTIGIAVLGFLVLRILVRPSAKTLASNTIDCVLRGDGDCVFEHLSEREIRTLKLDRKKVQALLDEIVMPAFKKVEFVGEREFLVYPNQGMVSAVQSYLRNGVPGQIGILYVVDDSGVKSKEVVTDLVYAAMFIDDEPPKEGDVPAKLQFIAEGLTKLKPKLEAIGLDKLPHRDDSAVPIDVIVARSLERRDEYLAQKRARKATANAPD